jgi:hypothetical protein
MTMDNIFLILIVYSGSESVPEAEVQRRKEMRAT